MHSVTITDTKKNFSTLLARAAAGESFEITKRGKPVAKLCPPHAQAHPRRDPREIAQAVQRLKTFRGTWTSPAASTVPGLRQHRSAHSE